MRVLALDLGTKTLGLAISDKLNMISNPLKVLRYDGENFDYLLDELEVIVENNEVGTLVLGNPKNMDNSSGFASQRSQNFKKLLDVRFKDKKIVLVDERLSTVEAENILIQSDMRREKRKKVIDSVAAMIILDTYLRSEFNDKWKYY